MTRVKRYILLWLLVLLNVEGVWCVCGNPPKIENADIVTSPPYPTGTEALYSCYAGYTLSNDTRVICDDSSGSDKWPTFLPHCMCTSCNTTTTPATTPPLSTVYTVITTEDITTAIPTTPATTQATTTTTPLPGTVRSFIYNEVLPPWAIAVMAALGAMMLASLLAMTIALCCCCAKRCYGKHYIWYEYPEKQSYYYDVERGVYVDYFTGFTYLTCPTSGQYIGRYVGGKIIPPDDTMSKQNGHSNGHIHGHMNRHTNGHVVVDVKTSPHHVHHQNGVNVIHKNPSYKSMVSTTSTKTTVIANGRKPVANHTPATTTHCVQCMVKSNSECPQCIQNNNTIAYNTVTSRLGDNMRTQNGSNPSLELPTEAQPSAVVVKESPPTQQRPTYVVIDKVFERTDKVRPGSMRRMGHVGSSPADAIQPGGRQKTMHLDVRPKGSPPRMRKRSMSMSNIPAMIKMQEDMERQRRMHDDNTEFGSVPDLTDSDGTKHTPTVRYKFQTAMDRALGKHRFRKPPVSCECHP